MPLGRRGWSLVESSVTIVLLVIVGGAVAGALAAGQRSAREAAELRILRAELRDAAALLSGEIRGISALDTIPFTADTAFEFFTPVLHAIVCAAGDTRLPIIPVALGGTASTAAPDTGDLLWVWREDSIIAPGRWDRTRIAAYSGTTAETCAAAFDHPGARTAVVELASGTGIIEAGAPLMAVRRVRYSVYRGSDGGWYLGYRRCDALGPTRCQTVQPVSGPYRARADGRSGLTLRYFDSTGTASPGGYETPWRVEIVAHPDTSSRFRRSMSPGSLSDSAATVVAIRNAR
jgi:type II secretory pathway pseudopilin PulG